MRKLDVSLARFAEVVVVVLVAVSMERASELVREEAMSQETSMLFIDSDPISE